MIITIENKIKKLRKQKSITQEQLADSIGISFINAGKHKIALDCYNKIETYNLFFNSYFINKIEYAKSKCNM